MGEDGRHPAVVVGRGRIRGVGHRSLGGAQGAGRERRAPGTGGSVNARTRGARGAPSGGTRRSAGAPAFFGWSGRRTELRTGYRQRRRAEARAPPVSAPRPVRRPARGSAQTGARTGAGPARPAAGAAARGCRDLRRWVSLRRPTADRRGVHCGRLPTRGGAGTTPPLPRTAGSRALVDPAPPVKLCELIHTTPLAGRRNPCCDALTSGSTARLGRALWRTPPCHVRKGWIREARQVMVAPRAPA